MINILTLTLPIIAFFSLVNSEQYDWTPPCPSFLWTDWTDWSGCDTDGLMVRHRSCVCENDRTIIQPWWCSGNMVQWGNLQTEICQVNLTHVKNSEFYPCVWKWQRWSPCTENCGGGYTSRKVECVCPPGISKSCYGNWKDNETVMCNIHSCGMIKAYSKSYWTDLYQEYLNQREVNDTISWKFPNPHFECKVEDPRYPKSNRTFMDIITEEVLITTKNLEWTVLAKEYVAAIINVYNGYKPNSDGDKAIKEARELLLNCKGYDNDTLFYVYASKEKLSRLNNNIGGIDTIDSYLHLAPRPTENLSLNTKLEIPTVGLIIMIIGIIVVVISLVVWCLHKRKNYNSTPMKFVKDEFNDFDMSTDEDDIMSNFPATPTQLIINEESTPDD